MGKSRLVVAAARALTRDGAWPGGACLARLPADGDVAAALRDALGLDGAADVVAALAARPPTVLVIDDAEAGPDAVAALVARLRQRAPALRILVASRHALDAPLTEVPLGPLGEEWGVAMLRDRAVVAELDALRALVRRFDGLPLALEIVAGLVRDGADLDDLPSEVPAMQRALQTSWDRLDRAEQQFLAQATLFAGAFDLRDAEAVFAADRDDAWPVDAVLRLADDHHLLERTLDQRPAFRLLGAVATFVEARAREDDALLGDAVRRFVTHVAGFATRALPEARRGLRTALLADGLAAARHALAAG
ncbi:MAG: hypothetical protein R3F59_32645 [Myxococcota bacterium]